MADRQLRVTLIGDTKSLDRALSHTERRLGVFGKSVSAKSGKAGVLGSALGFGGLGKGGVVGIAAAATVGVLGKSLSSVISKAEEAQAAQANLDQAFKVSGLSTKEYGRSVDRTITKLSELAGIDDELVSQSFASLLRTTGDVSKATKDVALAADIARARHISLAAAARIVEKAENGQTRGLKALGVHIEKNTTSTEALEAAQKKFAGSAVRYGKTAVGAQDRLRTAFDNLQERIGQKLLPVFTKLTLKAIDFLDWLERNWPKIYATIKPVIDHVKTVIESVATVLKGVVKVIRGIVNGDWSLVWDGVKQVVSGAFKAIVEITFKFPAKILAALGKRVWAPLKRVGGWIKDAVVDGLRGLAQTVINLVLVPVNKVIAGLNKIPFVHIPKVSVDLGGPSKAERFKSAPRIKTNAGSIAELGASSLRSIRNFPSSDARANNNVQQPPVVVNVQVDGKTIASAMVPHLQKRTGKTAQQSRGRAPGAAYGIG